MANFRCERLFIRLDEPVPGLDHLKAVDPFALARLETDADAEAAGLTPLSDFVAAPFDRPRWRPAADGLATVRGLLALYRDWLERGHNPRGCPANLLSEQAAVLGQVERVLEAADSRDRRFYLLARDLA